MSYQVNAYQAERLNAALRDLRDETERYLARIAALLTQALDEEARDGGLLADVVADAISDVLHDELADARAAVGRFHDTDNLLTFPRLSARRRAAIAHLLPLRPEPGERIKNYG